jgi:hypothetical protein
MEEWKTYSFEEAHKHFAQSINGRVWELLRKPNRSREENDEGFTLPTPVPIKRVDVGF